MGVPAFVATLVATWYGGILGIGPFDQPGVEASKVAAMALIFGYIPAGLGVSPLLGLFGAAACIIALFVFMPRRLAAD